FAGALAAALGDTLGTEIGSASNGAAHALPSFRVVPHGTPGAVSLAGFVATMAGGLVLLVAVVGADLLRWEPAIAQSSGWLLCGSALVAAAAGGSAIESLVTGLAPGIARVPGWIRNLLTTLTGAAIARLVVGAPGT
ncbi:MAG: DUF92 domain-containing protein, partial [Planctomycetes bacterium]|nr:DUF92 domain-containing protein [Planctomycetota bacterium]